MKIELSKITQDLEQGTITENETRTLLLGVSDSLQICVQPKCYNKPKKGSCFCKYHGNNR